MADLHPRILRALSPGQYREHEMLRLLESALPAGFTIYHGLAMSHLHEASQRYGELDAVVVSPGGHLAVLEIKAGSVELSARGAFKRYGAVEKNLKNQAHAQLQGLRGRLREQSLGVVCVAHFLLLPDFRVGQGSIGYPRERIIDATQLDDLGPVLTEACRHSPIEENDRLRLHDFLADRFALVPDAACLQGQRQAATRRLAQGLATWVPRIRSEAGIFVVEATAGSGKTQLALTLLQESARRRQRARYVCFNRPLADHIARLAPAHVEVSTADELGVAALRATGDTPDFVGDASVFRRGREALRAASLAAPASLDLLIIDESQDFDAEWLEALLPRLKTDGRLYVLGDSSQAIYGKEPFDLPGATLISCPDNFRSSHRIVETINLLRLTPEPVIPQGPETGDLPALHVHEASDPGGLRKVGEIVRDLLAAGCGLGDIAIVSFCGRQRSQLLQSDALASWRLRRFTGSYDASDSPLWTSGELLAESVYRFKGQSAPAVIVCEMDFDALDEQRMRMLFVAMTRAQSSLHLVMSASADQALAARLNA
ncbi:nuclease-related domain-containing DEAD/DEAH box helicase [Variovorax saccharolyticus]|uniref:nuclease-related domain-containing DEAD/DEAH box helicase n=1 Tax=Variovorax saccharolyticus TaxID=3053516 RepID=UPI002575E721|nr:nuclease-related domain-containing DEAD/DEAH box helicase [Variovorax sp. J31P216]MDM0029601.1 ATP-binding domain-containing protein [Variovorax sp. J31P216]